MHAQGIVQRAVEQPVTGIFEEANKRHHHGGDYKCKQSVLEVAEVPQRPAGNVVGQKHFDEQIERLAQRVGDGRFAQIEQACQHDVGGQQFVRPGASERDCVRSPAQRQESRQQHKKRQQANMVKDKEIVDHAEAGDLRSRWRHEKQQHEKQRDRVAFAFLRDGQNDRGDAGVQPETVRKKGQ